MRQRSTFTALVTAVACGVGAVAPAYAASYEVTDLSDVPMNCNLQTDLPATFQGIADGAFYGEEYDLTFNLQVEAPAEVKPGGGLRLPHLAGVYWLGQPAGYCRRHARHRLHGPDRLAAQRAHRGHGQ